jgi:ABC-type sugar transport system ATPase subunit
MLELKQASRTVNGATVLDAVSLAVAPGRPTAIVGLSPAVREALGRLISGADRPQAGQILLDGKDVEKVRNEKGRIVRVGANGIAASGQKVSKAVSRDIAALAGVSGQMEAKLSAMSQLQRVKLGLAQAAAARPALLLIDAPAALLTAEARDELGAAMTSLLVAASGVILVLAGSADEALSLGGDIVVMQGGAVVQAGRFDAVSTHPVNLAAAIATSWPQLNTLPMTAHEGRGRLADGSRLQLPESVALPAEGACTLAFHPEDVTLERASSGCVRFVVRAAQPNGRFQGVSFAGATWLCPPLAQAPHPGALLNAFVDRARLMLFDAEGKAVT